MRPGETLLEMAQRHVCESEGHVRKQRDIIRRLWDQALPIESAEALLGLFEAALDDHRRSLARIEAEQLAGVRDAAGDLLHDRSRPGPDRTG